MGEEAFDHEPLEDVFAFCNRLAWQVGGPVLIHDAAWGVVAHSTLNQAIDKGRESTILQRAVPEGDAESWVMTFITDHMAAGEDLIVVPAVPDVHERRVVAVVRILGVPVGTIWAAESAGPLHPDVEELMAAAAKQASLLFHVQEDLRRRQRGRFVSLLLSGSHDEYLLAQYLGVAQNTPIRVVAVHYGDDPDLRHQVEQVLPTLLEGVPADALTMHGEECVYVVLYGDDTRVSSRKFAEDMARADGRLLVGGGRVGRRLGHAVQSRRDADSVIAYLRRTPGVQLGSTRLLRSKLALMRVAESLANMHEPFDGPLQLLSGLEDVDRTEAIAVLDAYFASNGNVSEAARQIHVHPNTFRYRLAKISDIVNVDLENREDRLLVELDLLRVRFTS